jgi:nitrite reductase/ring-hydroxylating ferredoxin subunit
MPHHAETRLARAGEPTPNLRTRRAKTQRPLNRLASPRPSHGASAGLRERSDCLALTVTHIDSGQIPADHRKQDAALAGASDWLTTTGVARRIGLAHAAANNGALALETASWLARRRGRHGKATLLSLAALGFLGAGIWLGEHLVYGLGTGVDTTAFQHLPQDWTDVAGESDVPADGAVCVGVDGVPVLLSRLPGGIVALTDQCTHRGGPLHEGTVADGHVTCPWHGSTFDLRTGYVVNGPASRPQSRLDVQIADGRVEVRRPEPRIVLSEAPHQG